MPAWGDRNLHEPRRPHPLAAVPRARARDDRDAGPGHQLPSVPARELAVRPQRRDRRTSSSSAATSSVAIDPSLFNVDRGLDRLRDDVLPRADVRPRGTTRSRRSSGWPASSRRRADAHGIEHPLQMTLGVSDGERLYAVRYSSIGGQSRTLFRSADAHRRCASSTRTTSWCSGSATRIARSSPSRSATCPGCGMRSPRRRPSIIQDGPDEQRAFQPRAPRLSRLRPRDGRAVASAYGRSPRLGSAGCLLADPGRAARPRARAGPAGSSALVLAFGAGALISAVSFDLFEEGLQIGQRVARSRSGWPPAR